MIQGLLLSLFLCGAARAGSPAARGTAPEPAPGPAGGDAPIRVTLLGTGNPRPSIDRFGPSTLVEAGPHRLVVDAGRGASIRLFQIGSAGLLSAVDLVLLTHLHSDHVVGLPDLLLTGWIFGRERPFEVHGPPGTAAMMRHIERAFEEDIASRRDRDERYPASGIEVRAADAGPGVVLERDGLKVAAFAVDHGRGVPAYGYRIDYGGRSVAFSGDTRYSDSLIEHARGVDVLIHEVVSPEVERRRALVSGDERIRRIIERHTTPEEAGRVFAAVAPRLAVFSHIVPSPARAGDIVPPTRRAYKGRLVVGHDLMRISIGRRIEVGESPTVPDR